MNLLSNQANVSVIVPCFRCTTTIKRAIQSIAQQTCKPVEVILIDDASGDATWETLVDLEREYSGWIRLYQLPKNMGAASARNMGWSVASQPYIAFLDSDDAWHPQKIEIQYSYMQNHPEVTLTGHRCKMLKSSEKQALTWSVQVDSMLHIGLGKLLLSNYFPTPTVMLKNVLSLRFLEGKRYVDDHLLWLEIVLAGHKAIRLEVELAAIYKPMYGASGLSSDLWKMEKAELFNYRYLYLKSNLSLTKSLVLQAFSLAKYIRRLTIVYVLRSNG